VRATTDPVRPVSPTFPSSSLDRILQDASPFTETGHYLYPDDADGNHTQGFFAFEPISRTPAFVETIADDMGRWATAQSLDVDLVFSPAQPAVRPLATAVARHIRVPTAFWEYLPSGRFGNQLVEGFVPRGSKALALNGVSLQGRCVGLRLPQFVERLGGTTVAAAVFAKGDTDLVRQTEQRMGERFYSSVQVRIPIYPPSTCPLCAASEAPPHSWREFAEARR
jgi:hypothetical protein